MRLLTIALVILLCSCASLSERLNERYKGASIQEVIANYGPPDRMLPDKDGGSIAVFSSSDSSTSTSYAPATVQADNSNFSSAFASAVGGPRANSYTDYSTTHRMFWFDESGRVTKVTVAVR